ncbi:beta-ketoacyl synthase N-terminal-like domain-containing protein [Rouxiella badensis]|nr:beta-ketoacyl synthase N-terminal-like domain-containing protein [Rouxiella badensis]
MKESGMNADKIAITGMACQFPGAENLDAYWQVVKNNKISTRRSSVNAQPADYCRRQLAGGFIRGVDHFDAEFLEFPIAKPN